MKKRSGRVKPPKRAPVPPPVPQTHEVSALPTITSETGFAEAVPPTTTGFVETPPPAPAQSEGSRQLPQYHDLNEKMLQAQSDLGVGVALWDGQRFQYVNDAYCRLLGYTAAELLALDDVASLLPPDEQLAVRKRIAERQSGREPPGFFETTIIHRDGHLLHVEAATRTLQDNGNGAHFISLVRDITERKAHEELLQQGQLVLEQRVAERTRELAEANERLKELDKLKSEFLAMMSHELRTPLNSIIGFATLLLDELPGPLNGEQQRQVQQVLMSGNHLLELINDVLDIARIEAGQAFVHLEEASVDTIIRSVVDALKPLADRKNLTLEIDSVQLPLLLTDVRKVRQIVLNLLNNGIKFTRKGGVRVRASIEDANVTLRFTDTGIGIRKSDLKRLFQPFQQLDSSTRRSYEGTGLGLYLCRKLAHLLGGDVRVESTYGKGSEFSLVLPILSAR